MNKIHKIVAGLILTLLCSPAHAATVSAALNSYINLTATVINGCTINTSANTPIVLKFNDVSADNNFSADQSVTANLTVNCASITPFAVKVDGGKYANGTQYRMGCVPTCTVNPSYINYILSGGPNNITLTDGGSITGQTPANNTPVSIPFTAKILAGTPVPPAQNYSDTVGLTIQY